MSNLENFNRFLDKALAEGQKTLQKKQKGLVSKDIEKESRQSTKLEVDGEKNKEVLRQGDRIQVVEYLDIIRKRVAPEENLRKFGPEDGKVAYSLIYQSRNTKSHDVIGIILNHRGELKISLTTLRSVSDFMLGPIKEEEFNPLVWTDYLCETLGNDGKLYRGDQKNKHEVFKIGSKKGSRQFTQTLADFYVGLKTGQGK